MKDSGFWPREDDKPWDPLATKKSWGQGKERPKCRKQINKILAEGNFTLEELALGWKKMSGEEPPDFIYIPLSDGMKKQARKMQKEKEQIR